MFVGFLSDNVDMGIVGRFAILYFVLLVSFANANECPEILAQNEACNKTKETGGACTDPPEPKKAIECASKLGTAEAARQKSIAICKRQGGNKAQALENGMPIGESGDGAGVDQFSSETFKCKCPDVSEPRQISDELSCNPKEAEKKKEGDEENPFECASGGGGGQQGQAAAQALQQRAQMENQCNQVYEQARVDCDPDSSVGFQGMLDEALAKAEKAKSAEKGNAKQACDEYTKAFKQASSELKSFRNKCASKKASCISSCNKAMVKNGEVNPLLAVVGACIPMVGMIGQMMAQANTKIEQVNLRSCASFEKVLSDADQKQKELTESMRIADKCQTELQESCAGSPSAAHCRALDTAQLRGDDLNEVDTTIPRDKDFSLDTSPLAAGGANIAPIDGKGKGANVKQATGASSAKLGGAGGGGGGAKSRGGGGGGFYSEYDDLYGRMKGDQYAKAPRGGGRRSSGYKSSKYSRTGKKPKKRRKTAGAGLDLKKYMNGGTGRRLIDGITPASGPGIFEKISNRYKVKKGSLRR